MVMETPSPQCVGREFVRQYYTLLNQAPEYLHRFYSHNSSFVHGGVEKPGEEQPPVMGQADIHKKILSLNFRDCHAKIRQVDSQATVGNAVVVQVTGELSNSGQPMRRFMQTFVLAPQSPKKYYVHNDIFRYQDEVFHDETDGEPQEEPVESEPENADSNSQPENVQDPSVSSFYEAQQPLSNGNAHIEDRPETPEEKAAPEPEKTEEAEPTNENMFESKATEESTEPEPETQTTTEAAKPSGGFTWASILQKDGSSGTPRQEPPKPQPVKQEVKPLDGAGSPNAPQPQRTQRPPRDRRDPRDGSRPGVDGDDFSRRSRYPDSQQLFVGNLPHAINEGELKKYFESYGKVQEVRINRKSLNRDVPNFGFVVFEEAETVQKVLEDKPIMLKGEHRLNVEEKKQRSEQGGRPGSGTRPGRGGGMGNMGPGRGGGPPGRGGGRGGLNRDNRTDNRGPPGGRGGFGPRR